MLLQQLRWFSSVVPILLLLLSGVCSFPAGSSRLRCYVCGGPNEEPCGDRSVPPPETTLRACPESALGCLTLAEGEEVTRTCVDLKIVDCKPANGKLYCYCDTDACNNYPPRITTPEIDDDIVPRHQIRNATSGFQRDLENLEKMRSADNRNECDDEDRCEGSGAEPEDRLVDAVYNAMSTSSSSSTTTTSTTTTTTPSTTTTKEETTTRGPTPVERTTKTSLVSPPDGSGFVSAIGPTSTPKPEPSRGGSFKSTQPLIIASLVAVLVGSVLRTKITLF